MRRRLLSLLLAVTMVLGMLPVPAFAASAPIETWIDGEKQTLTNCADQICLIENVEVTSYSLTIPEGAQELYIECDEGAMNIFPDYNSYDDICGEPSGTVDLTAGYRMLCIYNYAHNESVHLYLLEEGKEVDPYPFTVSSGDAILELNEDDYHYCDYLGDDALLLTAAPDSDEVVLRFSGNAAESSYVYGYNYDMDGDGYDEYVEELDMEDDGSYVISLPLKYDYLCLETGGFYDYFYYHLKLNYEATGPQFTAFVNGEEIIPIEMNNIAGKPAFLLELPAGTEKVDFQFKGKKDYHFYNDQGVFLGNGETNSSSEYTIPVQDAFCIGSSGLGQPGADGVLDGISVQKAGTWSAEYYIMFSVEEEAHEHSYDDGVVTTEPGCETEGVKTFTCEGCGDSYTEAIDPIGHAYADGTCGNCGGADPDYEAPSVSIIPEGAPFTAVTTDKGDALKVEYMDSVDYTGFSTYEGIPYYMVTIPDGAQEVYVTHPSVEIPFADTSAGSAYGYYANTGDWTGGSMTYTFVAAEDGYTIALPLSTMVDTDNDWIKDSEASFVADEDGYAEYAVAVERDGGQNDGSYDPICFFSFAYGEAEAGGEEPPVEPPVDEPDAPFLSIELNGAEIAEDRIEYKGEFFMGDTGDGDGWEYIHVAPYYHVTVPCGTKYVDVTYPEIPELVNANGKASGYATVIDGVDAVSSATVKGRNNFAAYTKNADKTQTVTTPVTGYTLNKNGEGLAISVEKDGDAFEAICFLTFEYDGADHVYEEKITKQPCVEAGEKTFTCTCGDSYTEVIPATGSHDFQKGSCTACGEKDPDYHEHAYDEGVITTQPDCVNEGVKTFTCACGDSYTEPVAAAGHSYDDGVETVPATCVAEGTKVFTCTKCAAGTEGHTKTETIAKLGHKYDEGVVSTEPGCETTGERIYTCSQCADGVEGHTKTETISATGHAYANGVCLKCGAECPVMENGAYQLATAQHLQWFADEVANGSTDINGVLTADITVDENWWGIGTSSRKFGGSFDGQGYTVTFTNSYRGLFNYVNGSSSKYADIRNVNTAGTITGGGAGIAATAQYVNIDNCINRADVTKISATNTAGIVGFGPTVAWNNMASYVNITNCGNEGTITCGKQSGGIMGQSQGGVNIQNCYNSGDVISNGNDVGGIIGYLQGSGKASSVVNCYNTGAVSGGSSTGGLVGIIYNGATISNCYNAGESYYGIIGAAYSKKYGTISNCYYLASASTMGIPADHTGDYRYEGKTLNEMNEASFVEALNGKFSLSCPTPVLNWQEAVSHTGMGDEDGCDVCGYGSTLKQSFPVTIGKNDGVTVTGDATAAEGGSYTFTVTVNQGYRRTDSFAVKVNGDIVAESETPDTYVYEGVQGPLTVTVEGVDKIPETVSVSLPNGEGKGYRVTAVSGSTTIAYGSSFQFKVTFHEHFQKGEKFVVLVNGSEEVNPDENGIYTLTNVCENKTVTVKGVEAKPYDDTADILLSITYGEHEIYRTPQTGSDSLMLQTELQVPYFDIGLYGMDYCYYNPDCYGFNADGSRKPQKGGTAESAYGVITPLHAFIYATEVHYLNVPADKVGTGWSFEKGTFQKAIRWSGGVGSIFMYLWDHGSNLNYYVNYEYPLGAPGWGSTSDQIALSDGDTLSAHMIASGEVDENGDANVETSAANGSAYGVFVVDDTNGRFDYGIDTIHSYEVKQGEEVDLTLFSSVATSTYDTAYTTLADRQLYWIHDDYMTGNVTEWNEGEGMVTDEDGRYILDTSDFEPGVYYIGALGGFTEGDGKPDAGGFVSAGYERGVAVLKLTVTEGEGGSEGDDEVTDLIPGDVNLDGEVDTLDALLVYSYYVGSAELTEDQLSVADLVLDGEIDTLDALKIYSIYKGEV